MGSVEAHAIVAAWPLAGPVAVRPADGGTNNLTRHVETGAGDYVLRVYQNTRDPARVRYEHAVLLALQGQGLSFRVPAPVPAVGGDTVAVAGDGALAALFARLPGAPPDRSDPEHLRACGTALAKLHAALRRLDLGPPPGGGTYGDLERVHPLVPDPCALRQATVRHAWPLTLQWSESGSRSGTGSPAGRARVLIAASGAPRSSWP